MNKSAVFPLPDSAQRRRELFTGAGIMAVLVLAAYWPALHAGYIWDDDDYIIANTTLRSLGGLQRIWIEFGAVPQYYPLVHTVFWLEYQLWELNPLGYHIINVSLHFLSALLLWRILTLLKLRGTWLTAVLFAVHPVAVESAAWITELKNVLSLFMALLSMAVYLTYRENPCRRLYAISLLCFILALLSKTVVCSLPAVLLVINWWQYARVQRREVVRMIPFFTAGLCLACITVWMEKRHVGAAGAEWALSALDRILIAGRALWFYMIKIVFPEPLIFIYPRWQIDSAAVWQYAFPIGFLLLLAAAWLWRRQIGRGALAALLIFAGVLVPALGFIDVYPMRYSFVADHFQYHAMPALLALLVSALACSLPYVRRYGNPARLGLILCCAAAIAACTLQSRRHSRAFANEESLWLDTIAKNDGAWIGHNNLGLILYNRGEIDAAMSRFEHVLKLKSDHCNAHANIGRCLMEKDELGSAYQSFEEALRCDPSSALTLTNLGNLYARLEEFDKALACFERVLGSTPSNVNALVNVGNIHAQKENWTEAESAYRRAIAQAPEHLPGHLNLGYMHLNRGDPSAAETAYSAGLNVLPDSPELLAELAKLLRNQSRAKEALALYEQLVQLRPDDTETWYGAAQTALAVGDYNRAAGFLNGLLERSPNHTGANFRMGMMLLGVERLAQARKHFEIVLKAEPDWVVIQEKTALVLAATGDEADLKRAQELLAKAEAAAGKDGPSADLLDCRGVVLAASGKLAEAIVAAEAALAATANPGQKQLIARRLALYREGKPYRK